MTETFKGKRVKFRRGAQRMFILRCQHKTGLTLSELAQRLNISVRTLSDWKREKFLMSYGAAHLLGKMAKTNLADIVETRERFWYTKLGAKKGWEAVYKKYGYIGGDPARRKKKWREWWNSVGKFRPHPLLYVTKPIQRPKRSELLAEFIGIMMGDGGMSERQIHITLHHTDDRAYKDIVVRMIKKLFNVIPSVYHSPQESVNTVVVSRTELVKHLHSLGLPIGNKIKQQFDIPDWIKTRKAYRLACVRGLIDTDGSVFMHRYFVNGKSYAYKKLSFTSLSTPLTLSVHHILTEIGLHPRLDQGKNVRLESVGDVRNYFQIVRPRNPKHLKRYFG